MEENIPKYNLKTVYGIYDDIIEINNDGTEVFTKERISKKTGKIIERRKKKVFLYNTGYFAISMINEKTNKKSPVLIHRLVCMAWNGLPSKDKNYCRHLDDNKLNNYFGNLMWGSQSENVSDAIHNKKFKLGIQRKDCKLSDNDVINIINDPRKSSEIAKDYPVSYKHISAIKRREERKYLDTSIESENYGKK